MQAYPGPSSAGLARVNTAATMISEAALCLLIMSKLAEIQDVNSAKSRDIWCESDAPTPSYTVVLAYLSPKRFCQFVVRSDSRVLFSVLILGKFNALGNSAASNILAAKKNNTARARVAFSFVV